MTSGDNRSIIARDVSGSVLNTGDNNRISNATQQTLPPPETVDVKAELASLKELLLALKTADRNKLNNAVADATEEAAKPKPDKEEVAGALERVAKYAKQADDFGDHAEKIVPRLVALGSWLGTYGRPLLAMLGAPV